MQLYLITHAHTKQEPGVESTRWELSDVGTTQAVDLARQPFWEKVDRIVLSSEAKTRLTVQPVLDARPLPMTIDPRFDELRRGGWVGDYVAQVQQAFAQPEVAAGEWEPAAHALARFITGMDDLSQRFTAQTLALVGHGLTFSLYRAFLLGSSHVSITDWQALSFAAVAHVDLSTHQLLADFQPVSIAMPRSA